MIHYLHTVEHKTPQNTDWSMQKYAAWQHLEKTRLYQMVTRSRPGWLRRKIMGLYCLWLGEHKRGLPMACYIPAIAWVSKSLPTRNYFCARCDAVIKGTQPMSMRDHSEQV